MNTHKPRYTHDAEAKSGYSDVSAHVTEDKSSKTFLVNIEVDMSQNSRGRAL